MVRITTIVILLLAMVANVYAGKVKTAEDVIRAMHDRYAGKWYRTLTFVQKSTDIKPDGTTSVSIWYEALSLPGRLRIDFDPMNDGNGILFANDMQYSFKGGKMVKSQERIHPLMVLGFDVYGQPVDVTLDKLRKLKFDLTVMHEDQWQGRPVYVVGAARGDLRSHQFWIDKKELYFVRLIAPGGKDDAEVHETQFNKYQLIKTGGWVSPEVVFLIDGKRAFLEEYSDIRAGGTLDDALFDTAQWTKARWR